ncbi:MAG: sensor histidine kinase [bacterium]
MLGIALFPIGIIAVYQTGAIEQEALLRQQSSLLSLTSEAAGGEESMLRAADGALSALATMVPTLQSQPDRCSKVFVDFVAAKPEFSFAGYVNASGRVECASRGVGHDVSDSETFREMQANPHALTNVNLNAQISQTSVVIMAEPVGDIGFDGYVLLSLPHTRINDSLSVPGIDHPLDLILFNPDGDVLSAQGGLDDVWKRLPSTISLKDLADGKRRAFTTMSGDGKQRVFAVVPIVAGDVYAIGNWSRDDLADPNWRLPTLLFPLLMWFTSFAVAYLAVHRMVIRHINRIVSEMRTFISTRRVRDLDERSDISDELHEIDRAWHELAATVVHDEADLQHTIKEKTVLLKEVHHRVKNNLQLIASIVNLKVRRAASKEAKTALREVQMRVMTIANVHKALYEASQDGLVPADGMIEDVVNKTVKGVIPHSDQVDLRTSYQAFALYPDQAIPLSMLAAEAVTNALKFVGKTPDGATEICVDLERIDDTRARLTVVNTMGEAIHRWEDVKGTGLGTALMQAFARQTYGELTIEDIGDQHRVSVEFVFRKFSPDQVGNVEVDQSS